MEKIAEAGNLPGGVAITLAQPGALATGAGAVFLGTGNFWIGYSYFTSWTLCYC